MSKDWNWHDPECKEDVIVPTVQGVAVYTNPDGDIVIRQQGWPEDDCVIVIPRSFAAQVADAIKSELE